MKSVLNDLPFDFLWIIRYMYKTRFCFRLCSWQKIKGFDKPDFHGIFSIDDKLTFRSNR
jgi:hypothetical protein